MLIPHSEQLHRIARLVESARRGLLRYLEKFFDENDLPAKYWPQYVKNQILKHVDISVGTLDGLRSPNLKKYAPLMADFMWEYSKEPKTLTIKTDLSDFDLKTQGSLLKRMDKVEIRIPDDAKRHEYQKSQYENMDDSRLINNEPVIIKMHGFNEIEVVEGWHRTIQLLNEARKRKLKKVKYKAFVGTKGNFFTKIDYYLDKLNKYLYNVKIPQDYVDTSLNRKTPYREVVKERKEQLKQFQHGLTSTK